MSSSNYRFTLNVQEEQSQVSLPVRLGDTNRSLYISIADGGKPFTIEEGSIAVFVGKKADETTITTSCIIEGNSVVRYSFNEQTASYPGIVDCEIRLYNKDGKLIASPRFIMVVDERVIIDGDIVSENWITTLDELYGSEAQRRDAETKRVTAEWNRVTAEKKRADDETARVTAENERAEAESLRESEFEYNESLRQSDYDSHESLRQSNFESFESSRQSYYESNESSRQDAYASAEEERWSAYREHEISRESRYESEEQSRWSTFDTNETSRASAESARVTAEKGRVYAETSRKNNEDSRINAENWRVKDENSRNTYEQARRDAEKTRVSAESERASAESTRVSNEEARVSAEDGRAEAETARELRLNAVEKKVEGCANAIHTTASGETIRVDAVSTNEHTVKCKVKSDSSIDLTSVKVTRCGKNLLKYPYYYKSSTVTSHGITFTDKGDGTVIANGAATATVTYYLQFHEDRFALDKGKQYFLSGCPSGGSSSTYIIQGTDGTSYYTDFGDGNLFTANGNGCYFYIAVYEGTTLNNVVFKPQLEEGTVATEYQPYESETFTPLSDGTVEGIKSVAPTMTLFTDTEGVEIEIEYNQDINVLLDYIKQSLRAILDLQNSLIGGEA